MDLGALYNPRILEIEEVLLDYCRGNFSKQVRLTGEMDIYDSFAAAVNMVGEELSATTVNRNYFLSIFNEVDSILLIASENGDIHDRNKVADAYLKTESEKLNIQDVLILNEEEVADILEKLRVVPGFRYAGEGKLLCKETVIDVTVKINFLRINQNEESYIITLNDISELIKKDRELVKAIITTQEQERNRLAQDLHDDIGQQLSGLKMFMQVLSNKQGQEGGKEILNTCVNLVDAIADEIRSVCFNLMPRTLNELGIEKALELLLEKTIPHKTIDFRLLCNQDNPNLDKDFEVNVFRIIQEFVNNSIRHSECSLVTISVIITLHHYEINLSDNGKGFDKKHKKNGMGLLNIATRSKFIQGETQWTIKKGKGVHLRISGMF
jgi:signal transduction histidine kinase